MKTLPKRKKSSIYKGPERRKYKRIKGHFIAKFQIKPRKSGDVPSGGGWVMVTLENLSAGGILFNYDKKIKVGTIVSLSITFPLLATPINCLGKIIRIEELAYSPVFHIAAIFIKIDKREKETIRKAAERTSPKKSR